MKVLNKIYRSNFLNECFQRNFSNERCHIKMSQYFPKPFRSFVGNINVNASSYAILHTLRLQVLH